MVSVLEEELDTLLRLFKLELGVMTELASLGPHLKKSVMDLCLSAGLGNGGLSSKVGVGGAGGVYKGSHM